jgi:hypothetical protein
MALMVKQTRRIAKNVEMGCKRRNIKRYEEHRATLRDILFENSKKDYPKPVAEFGWKKK